jgi:hypothetical protein
MATTKRQPVKAAPRASASTPSASASTVSAALARTDFERAAIRGQALGLAVRSSMTDTAYADDHTANLLRRAAAFARFIIDGPSSDADELGTGGAS